MIVLFINEKELFAIKLFGDTTSLKIVLVVLIQCKVKFKNSIYQIDSVIKYKEHNHVQNRAKIVVKKTINKMKEKAITTIMPTRSLLAETSSKVIKYSFNTI